MPIPLLEAIVRPQIGDLVRAKKSARKVDPLALVIREVAPNSMASAINLRPGMRLERIAPLPAWECDMLNLRSLDPHL
jgi:hypothetical protein